MYGLILNLLQLVSEVVVFVCIAAVLLVSDGRMVLFISALLILVLWLIKVVIKPIMTRAGKENQD